MITMVEMLDTDVREIQAIGVERVDGTKADDQNKLLWQSFIQSCKILTTGGKMMDLWSYRERRLPHLHAMFSSVTGLR